MKKYLNELLEKAKITSVQRQENASIIDDIKKLLGSQFDAPVYFRRGGSLAKKTANIYDADIDLLCYLDDSTNMTLEQIYEDTYLVLSKTYIVNKKNSAIEILGKQDDYSWDYRIDIVPGKYVNYESSYDVFYGVIKIKRN
ncbi:hypothetical protein BN85301070 [Paracholeplasma brassicae]|uniref:Polymerase nucleotidyl transferase domain-containing protein n=1 Tax=Acholeplasma brassicae TaxID=61635 RepID=U4KQT3_9MOLU|nr:nucleotidyltransferase domain-containing protein [Paracholeplasma brassicae]CCV65128.1 hypothetical protein BN85301070 [Paracholeplasma brassicae]